ncbi:MAG: pilus assembly protein TadG-related protein [Pseudomonadota bacterium]
MPNLKNLLSNDSGNVLYMTAISMIPLFAMIGSGVDIGRSYMAQNRLQNACDAGVLAARKTQSNNNILQDASAIEAGEDFFDHNFADGSFGVATGEDTFVLTRGETPTSVKGTASVNVRNVIMQVFGFEQIAVNVECEADIDAQNTDVMMVLDTTLSMRTNLNGVRKIDALKDAVEQFYEIVQAGYVPGRNRIRYGVMPYAGTVNVGQILIDADPSWVVGADPNLDTTHEYHTRTWNGSRYDIGPQTLDVSDYVASIDPLEPQASVPGTQNPTLSSRWTGCIEERATYHVGANDLFLDTDDALDMNIDLAPTSDYDTRWRPFWLDVSRRANGNAPRTVSNCPDPARKMGEVLSWDDGTSNSFSSYINNLDMAWGTDQIAGLAWGVRFMSQDGLFAAENATAPNGQPITRHLVFMTDGELAYHNQTYNIYGMNEADGRFAPTGNNRNAMRSRGYNRMEFMCDMIKAKGITIWTVEFQNDATVTGSLLDCASSPDHAFPARNAEELNAAFGSIAQNIAGLRLL